MSMPIIYVAGPYRGDRPIDVKRNIRNADIWGERLVDLGIAVHIPHKNTEGYEGLQNDQWFLDATMESMRRCDAVFLIPGWEKSSGARGEKAEAERLGIPVFDDLKDLYMWFSRTYLYPEKKEVTAS